MSTHNICCHGEIRKTKLAAVAQSDACQTGDQEVASLLSLPLIQEGQLSVSGERMCAGTG